MKIKALVIKNIGIIADETIQINQPLIIFYGEVRQGKTTILSCVRWVCGGEFPADILRHGTKEGFIELQFEGGHIRREFYFAKNGKEIKSRPLEFVRDGRPVSKPVNEVERLLNPFTLDQDYLIRMKEAERNRFFIELFGVNTADIDTALYTLEKSASDLRAELKGYGDIDLTEHKPADVSSLQASRGKIIATANEKRAELEAALSAEDGKYMAACDAFRNEQSSINSFHMERNGKNSRLKSIAEEMVALQERVIKLGEEAGDLQEWLIENPIKPDPKAPVPPDTTELKRKISALYSPDTSAVDAALSDAAAANVRNEQYQKNLARARERDGKQATLDAKELEIKTRREEKIGRLKSINEQCKIEGLKFNDDGEFSYDGTSSAMLSTSQLILLSAKLSDLYPPGLGIELLDRGESLGKSIFELVDRAKSDEKTILCTVVGERPAAVPEQVGVFVVENGKVSLTLVGAEMAAK